MKFTFKGLPWEKPSLFPPKVFGGPSQLLCLGQATMVRKFLDPSFLKTRVSKTFLHSSVKFISSMVAIDGLFFKIVLGVGEKVGTCRASEKGIDVDLLYHLDKVANCSPRRLLVFGEMAAFWV